MVCYLTSFPHFLLPHQKTLDTSQRQIWSPGFAEGLFNVFITEISELLSQASAERRAALYPEESNLCLKCPPLRTTFLNMTKNYKFHKKFKKQQTNKAPCGCTYL